MPDVLTKQSYFMNDLSNLKDSNALFLFKSRLRALEGWFIYKSLEVPTRNQY